MLSKFEYDGALNPSFRWAAPLPAPLDRTLCQPPLPADRECLLSVWAATVPRFAMAVSDG